MHLYVHWMKTTDMCVSIYLLRCVTVNHVRHERDLPVQEGGRSQVQWNLVCHHHCDVHSWRNSLNCPTWESTQKERKWGTRDVSIVQLYIVTETKRENVDVKSKKQIWVFPCTGFKQSNRILEGQKTPTSRKKGRWSLPPAVVGHISNFHAKVKVNMSLYAEVTKDKIC